jgi:hypothetical protein
MKYCVSALSRKAAVIFQFYEHFGIFRNLGLLRAVDIMKRVEKRKL